MGYVKEMQEEWINICRPQFQQYDLLEMCLISKHYWLIKWLVDNDKIEWSEKTAFVTFLERGINADKSDALVSLLAVKENPIEFLCSVLK